MNIRTNKISKTFLYCGILSLVLAISSIIILITVSGMFPAVFPAFGLILLFTCPLSLTFLFVAYRRGKQPPNVPTKITLIKSQFKSFRLKDESKTYVCMVCKIDLEVNQSVLICPSCNSYYHEKHLIQWLQVNTTCPVCSFDYYQSALKNRKKIK